MTAAAAALSASALITACWQPQGTGQALDCWTVLDTGFGGGAFFLDLVKCWRSHPHAPGLLHYVGLVSAAQAVQLPRLLQASAAPDAAELATLCYGLEPGFQRLLLADGQVSLTLCVGETWALLSQQQMQADSLLLACPAQPWDKWGLKALARCCKRGAQLRFDGPLLPAVQLLGDAGFDTAHTTIGPPSIDPYSGSMHAAYNPRWPLRTGGRGAARGVPSGAQGSRQPPGRCAVIGAGMAGASVARALALRGFAVDVYDAAAHPAAGASGLPLGLVVPHHSADDSPRSRMSRSGTRLMLQHASHLLQAGQDWQPGGVLELCLDETAPTPTGWARAMAHGEAQGLWHPHAAWIKPARLVQRWLEHPRIAFHGQAAVHSLERQQDAGPLQWLLRDAQGQVLGRADCVVLANAHGCVDLVQRLAAAAPPGFAWVADGLGKLQAMQRMYGTLSYGLLPATPHGLAHSALPAFPVNGHGSFVSGIPTAQGPCWYAGATFQSDADRHALLAQEHAANFHKLQALLPAVAEALEPGFASPALQAWQGSRCISHDRLPLVGPLEDAALPSLWLCAGMGARGLSFSALCAELLAALMGGEPRPLEAHLARALDTRRPRRSRALRPAPPAPCGAPGLCVP